ncbi:MAG: hypothetical protein ACRDNF_21325 [Streptosporangiaceae bacterium]
MGAQQPTEWREHRRALWRFILLALQPWPLRWLRVADFMIAIVGAVAAAIIGFFVHSPLVGAVVFLAVIAILLLIAGMRVERELRGDSGIRLADVRDGEWTKLAVTNDSGKRAQLRPSIHRHARLRRRHGRLHGRKLAGAKRALSRTVLNT